MDDLKSNILPLIFYIEGIVWKRLLFSEESNRWQSNLYEEREGG